ncbi:MAG: hypothetical protein KGL48_12885 [Sphingomonadales bacterium]|nr:hypothetical protein [Sphingomonadales bacterium]
MAFSGTDGLAMTPADAVADRCVIAIANVDIPVQQHLIGPDFGLGYNPACAASDHARAVRVAGGGASLRADEPNQAYRCWHRNEARVLPARHGRIAKPCGAARSVVPPASLSVHEASARSRRDLGKFQTSNWCLATTIWQDDNSIWYAPTTIIRLSSKLEAPNSEAVSP